MAGTRGYLAGIHGERGYAALFGGGIGRIAIAGLVALAFSSTGDLVAQTYTLRWPIWRYVGASNGVSLAVDTLAFTMLAFPGNPALGGIIVGQYIAKMMMTLVSVPLVYWARAIAPTPASAVSHRL